MVHILNFNFTFIFIFILILVLIFIFIFVLVMSSFTFNSNTNIVVFNININISQIIIFLPITPPILTALMAVTLLILTHSFNFLNADLLASNKLQHENS